ncbi:MAG: Ig-like domain-containing protein, partial [Cyanophyceae cyanobacterium]
TPGIQDTFTVAGEGTYTVNAAGVVTFTPLATFTGVATPISYTVDDEEGNTSNIATITVTVDAAAPPTTQNDTATTPANTPVDIPILDNDTDGTFPIDPTTVDLDPNTPGIQDTFTVAGEGTYTVNAAGVVTFTPLPTFTGVATPISYTVDDEEGNTSNIATITVTVADAVPPSADNDTANTPFNTPVRIPVLDNDIRGTNPLDPTSVTITNPPTNGTVTVDPVTGVITYTPNPGFTGTDTFTYQVCDTSTPPLCDTATVSVTVGAAPTPIPGETDTAITPVGTPIQVDPLTNDPPGSDPLDPTSVTIINPPTNGTVTVDPVTGVITYTPNPGFTGIDTFTYEICDTNPTPLCIRVPVTVTVVEVRLVKRITAVDGIQTPGYVNVPTDPNDDPGVAWPDGSTVFLQGRVDQRVGSSSTVQFSIYFLVNPTPSDFLVCDPLSPGFTYRPGSLSVRLTGQPMTMLSDAQDSDAGAFIPAGMPVPEGCGGIPNPNGVVVVTIEDGSPGIIRFEVTAPD